MKVHGPRTGQGVWRIKTNQELRELYKTVRRLDAEFPPRRPDLDSRTAHE
jgi:hypothetical protein